MSRSRNRRKPVNTEPTAFDMARDELFQHVIRCDVIGADPEHQSEWFNDTMRYMADRWHELGPRELTELRTLGERFAKPARTSAPVEAATPEAAPETAEEAVTDEAVTDEPSLDTVSA